MKTTVTLTAWEMTVAAMAGNARHIENHKAGRRLTHGADAEKSWQTQAEGALGEAALAKFLNVWWAGKGEAYAPDVGNQEVRTTSHENGRLILHDSDPDDRIFWLLCGLNGTYSIKGWIFGRDGKKQEYVDDPRGGRPAYFVPQSALNSPGEPPAVQPVGVDYSSM